VQIYEEDRRLTIRTEQKAVAHCWSTEGCSAMGGGGGVGSNHKQISAQLPLPPPSLDFRRAGSNGIWNLESSSCTKLGHGARF